MGFLTRKPMIDKETLQLAEKILYTIGLVTGFWKFTDAFFAYLHKRQRGFISDVVKEDIKDEIAPIKKGLEEMKALRESDSRWINEQLRKILDEIRK